MTANINIVLVKTSHPGNIGSTARANENYGFEKTYPCITQKTFHLTLQMQMQLDV